MINGRKPLLLISRENVVRSDVGLWMGVCVQRERVWRDVVY